MCWVHFLYHKIFVIQSVYVFTPTLAVFFFVFASALLCFLLPPYVDQWNSMKLTGIVCHPHAHVYAWYKKSRDPPWMYYRIWIQSLWRASIHSKLLSGAWSQKREIPWSKNTRIRQRSSALLLHHWAHSASALVTLLLRLCLIWVELVR